MEYRAIVDAKPGVAYYFNQPRRHSANASPTDDISTTQEEVMSSTGSYYDAARNAQGRWVATVEQMMSGLRGGMPAGVDRMDPEELCLLYTSRCV